MASKIQAAKIVMRSGIPLVIASGRKNRYARQHPGRQRGGHVVRAPPGKLQGRKRWIAFFHRPKGTLFVDAGAQESACAKAARACCRPGIARCEGDFAAGRIVRICDLDGTEFARGICDFDSESIQGGAVADRSCASGQPGHPLMQWEETGASTATDLTHAVMRTKCRTLV